MSRSSPAVDDRRTLFGWCMYDWANSAYATTVLAGLLPNYFADAVVGAAGVQVFGRTLSAISLWSFAVAASAVVIFVLAPVLGAIADYSASKKRFLLGFAYLGSASTLLLLLCGPGDVWLTLGLFVLAQVGFVGANVFYDAFLLQIASPGRLDRVSGLGYAYGYIGGGLQFALALGLVLGHDTLGISLTSAVRLGMAMTAVWWGGFTLVTAYLLQEAPPVARAGAASPTLAGYIRIGLARTLETTRHVARYRPLLIFLLAFMLYNDAIQTVISTATIYGTEELKLQTSHLMMTLLIIQVVAMIGALLFSWIAKALGTKPTVMLSLVLWSGVVVYAYFITTATEYFLLGGVVGLVLGGSQALSRSFYSSMIPAEASAEFFGFYTVFSKFSAIWGPLVFGLIAAQTGSARSSILSLLVFFIAGLVLLSRVRPRSAGTTVDASASTQSPSTHARP